MTSLRDAFEDLLAGSRCVGCDRPGRTLCDSCTAGLRGAPYEVGAPHLLAGARAWAAGPYEGALRAAVVAHKEEGVLPPAPVLGSALAAAVRAGCLHATDRGSSPGPEGCDLVLVPVPSRPGVVRQRGDDPLGRVVRLARRELVRGGWSVRTASVLRSHPGVRDQGGLRAHERADNLAGSLWCPDAGLRRLARWAGRAGPGGLRVVLCDDVVTTGATLGEAERALAAVGVRVHVRAVVAAVRLRRPGVGGAVREASEGAVP